MVKETHKQKRQKYQRYAAKYGNPSPHYGRIKLGAGDENLTFETATHETGLICLNGAAKIAVAGDVLHFPPMCRHGATMLDEEVVLIDIFSPIREDFLQK